MGRKTEKKAMQCILPVCTVPGGGKVGGGTGVLLHENSMQKDLRKG